MKNLTVKRALGVREMPAYNIAEASHYLRIPRATLASWVKGRWYDTEKGKKFFKPLLELPDNALPSLSFINLVEAHVLDALRRDHNIPMYKIRAALDYVQKNFSSKHPLIDQKFETDGMDLFVSAFEKLISVTKEGQLAMREMISAYLKRVERDEHGIASRLYPFTRKRDLNEPRLIVIDPEISFGRPVIVGTGIATSAVAERFKAGESLEELAKDYGCDPEKIQEAVRCELQLAA